MKYTVFYNILPNLWIFVKVMDLPPSNGSESLTYLNSDHEGGMYLSVRVGPSYFEVGPLNQRLDSTV